MTLGCVHRGHLLRPAGDWACCRRTPKPRKRIVPRQSGGRRGEAKRERAFRPTIRFRIDNIGYPSTHYTLTSAQPQFIRAVVNRPARPFPTSCARADHPEGPLQHLTPPPPHHLYAFHSPARTLSAPTSRAELHAMGDAIQDILQDCT
eukprot:scaffold1493_cov66-Phaeocystis_antarctica.AAC.4